jgi:uncharacterized ferredoxin-like protein
MLRSDHCSVGLEGSTSGLSGLACAACGNASATHIVNLSSVIHGRTFTGTPMCDTCQTQKAQPSFAVVFHVRTLVQLNTQVERA